ncbi:response regulator transcription factor [Longispora sp. NPDC051575]|uniref:response regulator transcription factor n=1 Tax=Longispora sp. NPDC051575 TaxID=3154943 RepID=UPI003429ACA7
MAKILLIDDEATCRQAAAGGLSGLGHHVTALSLDHVGAALIDGSRQAHGRPDIVVLDPSAPGIDSVQVTQLVRLGTRRPVIVTAELRGEADIARLFDVGAESYMPKPCSAQLLDAQIGAVLRRVPRPTPPGTRVVGQLHLDVGARVAFLNGRQLQLTQREFDLLDRLSESPGAFVPRTVLKNHVRTARCSRTVDVLLCRLRAKLGEDADNPRYLHSSRGSGVALREPAAPSSTLDFT